MADEEQASEDAGVAVGAAKKRYASFLETHPDSTIESVTGRDGEARVHIRNPWSDSSLDLVIPDDDAGLAEALNSCRLPHRLIAIYHQDKRSLEVIWTAYPLSASMTDVASRKFTFTHKRKKHVCQFVKSSERLLSIAGASKPVSEANSSNFRNLASFARWKNAPAEERSERGLAEPMSFWISNIKWSDEGVVTLANALNFYMTYYDDMSPTIVVLPPLEVEQAEFSKKTRYVSGSFPSDIAGTDIDQTLISFWTAALAGNQAMKFILYYRIIEYASHQYLDDSIRHQVRRLMMKPDFLANPDNSLDVIVGLCMPNKQDDVPKFKGVLKQCVDMGLVWKELEPNIEFFRKETKFDGGFSVGPLLSKEDRKTHFENGGRDKLSDCFRHIRNTLSHGRDLKTGKVITPTARNFRLLGPWVQLIKTAAAEVVIYRGLT